jgi:CBS domain-containing protein
MSLSQMNSDPRALGLGAPICPLTPANTIAEAAARMRGTGESTAVVTRRGEPIGLVGADVVLDAIRTGRSEAPLASVMDRIIVRVDVNADESETLHRFTDAAWDWLLSRRPPHADRRGSFADRDRAGRPSPLQDKEQHDGGATDEA